MAQLCQDYSQFVEQDTEIVVVGPDSRQAFTDYFGEHALPFIGLPDSQHSVLKLYGQQIKIFKLGRMPAQILIDKTGMARFVHYGHSMRDIPANEEILGLIDKLPSK